MVCRHPLSNFCDKLSLSGTGRSLQAPHPNSERSSKDQRAGQGKQIQGLVEVGGCEWVVKVPQESFEL